MSMKRQYLSGDDTIISPLKKKSSSLLSIDSNNDESENFNDNTNDSNCNSASSSSVGLDLMAKDNNNNVEEIISVFSSANNTLRRKEKNRAPQQQQVSASLLSSTTEDDREELLSLTQGNAAAAARLPNHSDSLGKPQETVRTADQEQNSENQVDDFLRSGLVFEIGTNHFNRHNRLHIERPRRITSIMKSLKKGENNLYSKCCVLGEEEEEEESSSLAKTTTPSATAFLDDEDYLRVHLPGYMKRLDRVFGCNCCEERLDREAEQYTSIFFTKDSLIAAKKAASSLCSLVEHVEKRKLDNGFAIIRPPGHHAEPGLAGGYCIINNVAVAASYAREMLGVGKILIVDWDVHHGNGTQSIFIKDPSIMYFSVHRWQGGNFYPFISNGGPTNIGIGKGAGFNMNVGWSRKGMGDDEYLAVWERLLLPVAKEFQPALILISAGFDAAEGDIGECNVTPECFGRLTRSLMSLNTPIVCSLEGGYVKSILSKCVQSVISSLLDPNSAEKSKTDDDEDRRERGDVDVLDTIDPIAAKNIRATIAAHKSYWKCLQA